MQDLHITDGQGPKPWTVKELAVLREKYGHVRASRLARQFGRSRFAVISQARRQNPHERKPC